MQSKTALIDSYLREGSQLRLATIDLRDEILRASDAISKAFRSNRKLLTFGNGGSAADAQHIAAGVTDLLIITGREKRGARKCFHESAQRDHYL